MTRLRRAVLGSAACLLATLLPADLVVGQSPPAGTSTQAPVFRGGVNYVLVDAYPRRNGQIVEGLTAADFQILEDGKPQAIDALEFVRVAARQSDDAYRDPNNLREMNEAAADPRARVFVVYLDTIHTTVEGSQRIRVPLVQTLNSVLSPRDLFGVMTPDLRPSDLTLQRRTLSVEDQLARFWTWGRDQRVQSDPRDPMEDRLTRCFELLYKTPPPNQPAPPPVPWLVDDDSARRTLDKVLIDRRREDRILTGLTDLVINLGTRREARSVLMVITDGWHLYPPNRTYENEPPRDWRFGGTGRNPLVGLMPGGRALAAATGDADFGVCVQELNRLVTLDNEHRLRDLIAEAQRSNVSIYPVSSAGLQTFETSMSEPAPQDAAHSQIRGSGRLQAMSRMGDRVRSLQTLAENTDGLAIVQNNDLGAGMKRIVDDVSAYYLIGYYTTNGKADGRFRKIEVKTTRKDIDVHARRGYLAPSENVRARAATTAAAASPASAGSAAVDEALGMLARAQASADLFVYGVASGTDALSVAVELGNRPMSSGDWAKGATVLVDAVSAAGQKLASVSGSLEPGARGARLTVPVTGTAGPWKVTAKVSTALTSLNERADVAARRGGLLSDAVVSRATPSPRSPLVPVAGFEFRRNERVHIEWVAAKPLDERTVRVLDRRGQPLPLGATLTEREADGIRLVVVDLSLAALAEGDYVVELSAQSGAERDRRLVALRLVR